jgi:hypothetical protein
VPDAQIVIRWAGRPVAENRTDRSGRRNFELRQGSYEILVSKPGYRPHQGPLEVRRPEVVKTVVLTELEDAGPEPRPEHPDERPERPERPDERPLEIVFHVRELGARGILQPAGGAEVVIRFAGEPIASRPTDRGGRAAFELRRGCYQLVVNKPGFRTHVARLDVPGEVRPIVLQPDRR